jgi:hypothetical protein
MMIVKMTRRPDIPGLSESGRNDQFAGFLLGAAKGVLVVAFLTAAMEKYALSQIKAVAWADEQFKASRAVKWNQEYQPAWRIWSSRPVRHFVNHIHRMGWEHPAEATQSPAGSDGQRDAVQTADRPTSLKAPDTDANLLEPPSSSPSTPFPAPRDSRRPDAQLEQR